MVKTNYQSANSEKSCGLNAKIFSQDLENGAEEVESEEDSGIQSKEELPLSPEKKITPTKTKSNGGERLSEEAEQTVRSSGDGGRKKVGIKSAPEMSIVPSALCMSAFCV